MRHPVAAVAMSLTLAACAKQAPEPVPEPQPVVNVRLADVEAPIAQGDCNEAVRRAVARPDLDVDKVPAPLAMTPAPIDARRMPKGVADRNGYYNVKFRVLVDTLGKPDMATFAIDTATHAWLGTSVKSAVAKWKFAPAEVAGCKVPRMYSLGISPRGKTPAAPVTPKPAPATKPAATKPAAAKPPATKPPARPPAGVVTAG